MSSSPMRIAPAWKRSSVIATAAEAWATRPDCSALRRATAGAASRRARRGEPPAVWRWQQRYAEAGVEGFDQSTNVALVAGQEAYVRVDSLRGWSTDAGRGRTIGRDTFYAPLIMPQIARAEIVESFFDGGS